MKRLCIAITLLLVMLMPATPAWASHGYGEYYLDETQVEVDDNVGVGSAISNWNSAINQATLYSLGGTSNDDIIISYGDAAAACNGPSNTVGCAAFFFDSGSSYYCVVTIDDDYPFTSTQLRVTAEHEIGHCLSLGHSSETNSVMQTPLDTTSYITSHDASTVDNQIAADLPLPTFSGSEGNPPTPEGDSFDEPSADSSSSRPPAPVGDRFVE